MSRTFEELAGEELDALYQGALFLAAGEGRRAEELLVEALESAFREHVRAPEETSSRRRLERRLVQSFLRREGADAAVAEAPRVRSRPRGPVPVLGAGGLFRAAGALPAAPRAALWLVMLRRWGYGEAAETLGVGKEQLKALLEYRHVLMAEAMKSGSRRNGTDGVET